MPLATQGSSAGTSLRGGPVQAFFQKRGAERFPTIVRAEGIYMWDDTGRRYLDGSSGPVVNNLGHGNPRVIQAMAEQAAKVTYAYPSMFESRPNAELADLLTDLAGPGFERAFFVSGGSEATETALKLARQYAVARGDVGRHKVIGRDPSYHGATLGALAVTGDRRAEQIFSPLFKSMPKVPAPFTYRLPGNETPEMYGRACADALEAEILRQGPESVLAFIMEPVGGLATGALVAPDSYYGRVREICSRHGVLLIYDEVMSGAGRTGTFLAADHWPDARPDIVTLAKGIAAGYTPFGAVLAPAGLVEAVAESGGFMHTFTYFSNPLSCAIGTAVLREVIDRNLVVNAARMGEYLKMRLEKLQERSSIIGDIRGKGLLMAIELVAEKTDKRMLPREPAAPDRFSKIALKHGLALYSRRTSGGCYGDWIMISPPLTIVEEEIDEMVGLLERALADFEHELREQKAI